MNKHIFTLIGSICFLSISILCHAQTGTLSVDATNFETDEGAAVIQLFKKQDKVPKNPFMKATAAIANGKATIEFLNLPFGDYAAILFQDKNANGVLDHKFGFPNESMGFSNEWKLSLFSGMPNFEKLKFKFDESHLNCTIRIR
jgi:uncharacterized protein (DUF2141 family)